jgi:EpsI family protein
MTQKDTPNQRRALAAAVAASGLMLVFGLTYRGVAARLEGPSGAAPISQEALSRFPLQIGDWRGEEAPLDEAIIRATDTDAHLSRRYLRPGGLDAVLFYLASGVKARDLMPHRPEVCYTGAGWTLAGRQAVELPLGDSATLPCNILQFSRGALQTQQVVVLNYYLVDGQSCADVSLLRAKAWRGSGTVRYVAQIQITAAVTGTLDLETAAKTVRDFALASAAQTVALFDDSATTDDEDEVSEPTKGL